MSGGYQIAAGYLFYGGTGLWHSNSWFFPERPRNWEVTAINVYAFGRDVAKVQQPCHHIPFLERRQTTSEMSDEEFDDFSIDDDALNQIASLERTVDRPHQSTIPQRTAAAGSSVWTTNRKPPAGKAPAFQLRTLPLQGSSSSESGGVSVGFGANDQQKDRTVSRSTTTVRNPSSSKQQHSINNRAGTGQSSSSSGPAVNAIEVLTDDDDPEFEVCSPPPVNKTMGKNPGATTSVKSNNSAADAARIARANAIRGLLVDSNGKSNWLTTAQNTRQNGASAATKQTAAKNVKVTEWDPEKPQTQVVQTHLPFRPLAPKKTGKTWDRTAYSKSGQRVVKKASAKKKGKKKKAGGGLWDDEASDGEEDDEDEEDEEDGFDQFPMPFIDPSEYPFAMRCHTSTNHHA